MQISTNGLILFDYDDQFKSHAINFMFPRLGAPFIPIIAPLWVDLNFRDYGTIFYRVTRDESILNVIPSSLHPDYLEFRPTLAVVVTWFQSKLLRNDVQVSYVSLVF